MNRNLFKRCFSAVGALILALAGTWAFGQGLTAKLVTEGDASELRRIESFEKVWNTVNENHYDPTFGGIDWNAVKAKYEPLAKAAKTDDELHSILRLMLGELKLSHFGIFPIDAELGTEAETGRVGVEFKQIDGLPVVFRVHSRSGAAMAGVKSGMVLKSVGGKPIENTLDSLAKELAKREMTDASRNIYLERTAESLLNGKPGTKVTAEFIEKGDKLKTFEIERNRYSGEMSQPMGNFSAQEVIFESQRLPGNIGYLRFNMWVIPQMPKLRSAMLEFADASGIIIDLRGNPGGVGGMASGLAGLMFEKEVSLGSMKMRESEMNFIVYPQAEPYMGPVVVLVDHGSGSTSEIFAAGLQEIGRAKVIGSATAGAVLPSVFDTLPTNVRFQFAIADYRSPKAVLIEGRGVFPDIVVAHDRNALSDGRDVQLDRAIDEIKLAQGGK